MIIPELFYNSIILFIRTKDGSLNLSAYNFNDFFIARRSNPRTPIMEVVDNYFDKLIKELNISFMSLDIKF